MARHTDTSRPVDGGLTPRQPGRILPILAPKATDRPARHKATPRIRISVRKVGAK